MPSWLMKAEPETRLERGVDVKFSIDDLQKIGASKWDGVRNHEAKRIMKEMMTVGDKVLFYHSNCKVPGVYGLAEVVREGYPDFTAWDTKHPYFDARSKEDNPTWFMVDIQYKSHLANPVTLGFLKHLTSLTDIPQEVDYIGPEGLAELKNMALVNRGRLSVQPVTDKAYEIIVQLGKSGGFQDLPGGSNTTKPKTKGKGKGKGEAADARIVSKRAPEEECEPHSKATTKASEVKGKTEEERQLTRPKQKRDDQGEDCVEKLETGPVPKKQRQVGSKKEDAPPHSVDDPTSNRRSARLSRK